MIQQQIATRLSVSLLLTLLLLASGAGEATVIRLFSERDLVRSADVVVTGTVVSQQSRWASPGRHIYTFSHVRVAAVVVSKGVALRPEERIMVQQIGGVVGDTHLKVPGVSLLRQGEQVLLFLRKNPGSYEGYHLVGMAQGHYSIATQPDGRRYISRVAPVGTYLSPKGTLVHRPLNDHFRYESFVERIRSYAKQPTR